MSQIAALSSSDATMSSMEIAELTGKKHGHVKRDIEEVLNQAGINASKYGCIYKDAQNREQTCYNLPRRECDLVISGYSVPYRLAVIDRWYQLEEEQNPKITYAESLRLLADTIEERDNAIATKAEIGTRREATAMNTASVAVKKVNRLEIELDHSQSYCTVKRMQMIHHGQKFSWRLLKTASVEMELPAQDVFDANYGTVKAYHVDVWREAYAVGVDGSVAA